MICFYIHLYIYIGKVTLPPLTKTYVPTYKSKDSDSKFIESRKNELDNFLAAILNLPNLTTHPSFLHFLDIVDPYTENVLPESRHLLDLELLDPMVCFYGINCTAFDIGNLVLLTSGYDTRTLSRPEGSRMNIFNSFSQTKPAKNTSTEHVESVGSLTLWNYDDAKEKWKVVDRDKLSCPIRDIRFINPTRYVLAMEDGYLLLVGLNDALNRMTKLAQVKMHEGPITGLMYNRGRNFCVSCSLDKKLSFCTIDPRQNELEKKGSLTPQGADPLTSLCYVPEKQICFVAGAKNTIFVYLVPSIPPACVQVLELQLSSPITTLYWHADSAALLVGHENGTVSAYIQNIPASSSLSSQSSYNTQQSIPNKKFRLSSNSKLILKTPGMSSIVSFILLTTEGSLDCIFVGHNNGYVNIYGPGAHLMHSLQLHRGAVTNIVWVPEKKLLCTSSLDGRVKFWKWPILDPPSISTLFSAQIPASPPASLNEHPLLMTARRSITRQHLVNLQSKYNTKIPFAGINEHASPGSPGSIRATSKSSASGGSDSTKSRTSSGSGGEENRVIMFPLRSVSGHNTPYEAPSSPYLGGIDQSSIQFSPAQTPSVSRRGSSSFSTTGRDRHTPQVVSRRSSGVMFPIKSQSEGMITLENSSLDSTNLTIPPAVFDNPYVNNPNSYGGYSHRRGSYGDRRHYDEEDIRENIRELRLQYADRDDSRKSQSDLRGDRALTPHRAGYQERERPREASVTYEASVTQEASATYGDSPSLSSRNSRSNNPNNLDLTVPAGGTGGSENNSASTSLASTPSKESTTGSVKSSLKSFFKKKKKKERKESVRRSSRNESEKS